MRILNGPIQHARGRRRPAARDARDRRAQGADGSAQRTHAAVNLRSTQRPPMLVALLVLSLAGRVAGQEQQSVLLGEQLQQHPAWQGSSAQPVANSHHQPPNVSAAGCHSGCSCCHNECTGGCGSGCCSGCGFCGGGGKPPGGEPATGSDSSSCTIEDGDDSTSSGRYAYFPRKNGYLPGCVLSDMDGSAAGGCVHYATLAEAVARCDTLVRAPKGCVATEASGQQNGCTCAGVTKENTPKPYRLGAFPIIEDSGGPAGAKSWQRSADTCGLDGIVFLACVFVGSGLYLGVGGVLKARRLGDSSGWAMPNRQGWLQLRGLVSDGVSFAMGRAGAAAVKPALEGALLARSSAPIAPAKSKGKKVKNENHSKSRDRQQTSSLTPADISVGRIPPPALGDHQEAPVLTSAQAGGGGRWVKVPAGAATTAVSL